jgi:UDP-N-acetylmuramoyl-tripeptide--D-alanyl-D-alanine ligase
MAKQKIRSKKNLKIIGIVGSFGKTSTTNAIHHILPKSQKTDTNLDTVFNLPLTLNKLKKSTRYLVLEMGVDHKNEMDFHLDLVKPNIIVFTGITPVHSDKEHMGSLKSIKQEKGKAAKALLPTDVLIYNFDDKNVREIAVKTKAQKISYSKSIKQADIYLEKHRVSPKGTSYLIKSNLNNKSYQLKTKLIGKFFADSLMAAIAVMENQNLSLPNNLKKLEKLKPLKGRMSLESFYNHSTLLNDRLRANPASVKAGLETVSDLSKYYKRTIIVLGEMGELGNRTVSEHKKIGKLINEQKFDYVVGVGPNTRYILNNITDHNIKTKYSDNPIQAANYLKTIGIKSKDLIYLKASLLRHLERVEMVLSGKKVNCDILSCPLYNNCEDCAYLLTKYPAKGS